MKHLEQATLEDTQVFFRRYYHPANATLVVSGSFNTEKANQWIEQYFGPISSAVLPDRRLVPNPSNGATQQLRLNDAVAVRGST